MHRPKAALLVCVLSFATFACDQSEYLAKVAPPERQARARHYIELIADGQQDSLLAHTPAAQLDSAQIGFKMFDSLLHRHRLDSLQLIGANRNTFNGVDFLNLTYEGRNDRGWLAISIATVDSANTWYIRGMHVEPLKSELALANNFQLAGHPFTHYAMLMFVVLCLATSLGTAVYLATRRDFPNRWRWVLCSTIGAGTLQFNWTDGQTAFKLLNIQLLAGGYARPSVYAPWILSAALPLGALLALNRYRRVRKEARMTPAPEVIAGQS